MTGKHDYLAALLRLRTNFDRTILHSMRRNRETAYRLMRAKSLSPVQRVELRRVTVLRRAARVPSSHDPRHPGGF